MRCRLALAIAASQLGLLLAHWCRPRAGKCEGHRQELRALAGAADPFGGSALGEVPYGATIQVVDWNGDGRLDMLLSGSSSIRFFEGLPNGSMVESANCSFCDMQIPNREWEAARFAATDWDGDGDYDLLLWRKDAQNGEGTALLYFERVDNGTLSFRQVLLRWNDCPKAMTAADWDGDGLVDLFADTTFYRRWPDGWLEEVPSELSPLAGMDFQGEGVAAFAAADWDGDGDVDLIVGTSTSVDGDKPSVHYFQRMGDGSLSERQGAASPFGGVSGADCAMGPTLAVVDWDGDGLLDLVTSEGGRVHICLSSLDLEFVERTGPHSPLNTMNRKLQAPAVADWNGDGRLDLLLGSKYGLVQYFERAADGGLVEHELFPERHQEDPTWLETYYGIVPKPVDWDGDGDMDLFGISFSREGGGTLHYYERLANGTLERRDGAASPLSGLQLGAYTFGVEAVDWDADGDVDLITCESDSAWGEGLVLRYYERTANGDLLERKGALSNVHLGSIDSPSVVAVDWNGDGLLDLIATDYSRGEYVLYERVAPGGFALRERGGILPATGLQRIAVADWDGDGHLEAMAGQGNSDGGFMQYFDPGFCSLPEECGSRGWCNPLQGSCLCLQGYGLADCSACRPGYFSQEARSVFSPATSELHTCRACPGVGSSGGACSRRGVCADDGYARGGGRPAPARGSGRCLCSAPFTGDNCEAGECGAGEQYILSGLSGSAECRPCPPGSHKRSAGNSFCDACPQDTYAVGNGTADCSACASRWLRVKVNKARTSCDLSKANLTVVPLTLVMSIALFAVISLLLGHSLKVRDVRLQPEGVVLTTRGTHWLLHGPSVRFRETGHPLLDNPPDGQAYRVQILNDTQLLLLDADGKPTTSSIDTSKGQAHLSFGAALLNVGRLGLPFSLWACLLVVMIASTALLASMLEGKSSVRVTRLESAMVPLGFLLALGLHGIRAQYLKHGNLELDLKAFSARLGKANPDPGPCERGHLRAISAQQLVDFFTFFQDHIGSRNMYYICENLLRPLTRPTQLSYAELAGPRSLQWFCSHFWGTPFAHFVETIRKHAEGLTEGQEMGLDSLSYWICSFSNNQWKVKEELGQGVEESSFYRALRSGFCRGTVMILDEKVQPLTRSWCLFELLQTALLSEEQHEGFEGLLLCTPSGVMNRGHSSVDMAMAISTKLSTLRLQDASATSLKDKQTIDELVSRQAGGFEQVNRYLIQALLGALQATQTRFKEDLQGLRASLGSIIGLPAPLEED